MFKIVTVPSKILFSPNKDVRKFDNKLKNIIIDMEETLISQTQPEGVGLAAPQVGLNINLFIIKPKPDADTEVFINPKILKCETLDVRNLKIDNEAGNSKIENQTSNTKNQASNLKHQTSNKKTPLEGCLSIPRIWGPIKRTEKILVEYQNIDGIKKQAWFTGFKAVIIQHEVDHLQGILFTQRAIEQKSPLYEEKENKLKKISIIT